jgi:hypothetical protein
VTKGSVVNTTAAGAPGVRKYTPPPISKPARKPGPKDRPASLLAIICLRCSLGSVIASSALRSSPATSLVASMISRVGAGLDAVSGHPSRRFAHRLVLGQSVPPNSLHPRLTPLPLFGRKLIPWRGPASIAHASTPIRVGRRSKREAGAQSDHSLFSRFRENGRGRDNQWVFTHLDGKSLPIGIAAKGDIRAWSKSPSEHFTLRPRALQFGAA